MKRYRVFTLIALGLLTISAGAQALDDRDSFNREAAALFLSYGELYPITSWPAGQKDIIAALEDLATRRPPSASAAQALAARIAARSGQAYLSFELNYDASFRKTDRIFAEESARTLDTQISYLNKAPFASLKLGIHDLEGLSADMGFTLRKEWFGDFSSRTNLPFLGAEGNPLAFDNHNMERADLRYSTGPLSISFGRAPVKLGSSTFTSLYPDDSLPYLDRLGISTRSRNLRFDWYVATIQPIRAFDGYDVTAADQFEGGDDQRPTVLAVKRIAYQNQSFRLSLGETVLYSRANAYYTLTDFLPLIDWHSTDVKPNNMALMLDAGWVPLPGLETFMTLGVDEISTGIIGVADSAIPTIWAAILGAKGQLSLTDAWLQSRFQAGYAHYLWGNYDALQSSHSSDPTALARAIYRYKSDLGSILLPLSSPYGPGAAWLELDAQIQARELPLSAGLEFLVLAKYAQADLVSTPYEYDPSLAGIPPFAAAYFGLWARYTLDWAEFRAKPGLYITREAIYPSLDLLLSLRLNAGAAKP